jgi:hypothetical protein
MLLDIEALKATPVQQDPYPHLVLPFFVPRDRLADAIRDYPGIDMAGVFPLDSVEGGPTFQQIVADMRSAELRDVIAEKFDVPLEDHGTMITVRGCCRATDGKIHSDATFKKVTLLLYLNDEVWPHPGARLRILRSSTDLEDYAAEVPPVGGTLVAFKCVENAWHGHASYEGVRRYVMMNYVADQAALQRELARHRLSAGVKKVKRLFGLGKIA